MIDGLVLIWLVGRWSVVGETSESLVGDRWVGSNMVGGSVVGGR